MTTAYFFEVGLVLVLAIFSIGVFTMLMRRMAIWNLIGQIIVMKAVVSGAFLVSYFGNVKSADLLLVSLIVLGLLPVVASVGLLVIHRCSRFGGSLDLDAEDQLRN